MPSRRRFLEGLTLATAAATLPPLARTAAAVDRNSGDAQLLQLLRDTPRDRLLEALVQRIRGGLGHERLLGALAEATALEVSPYPVVGFKYHAFMALQAVHLTTVHGRADERWLPLLWAADRFKVAQAQNAAETGWTLGPPTRPASPTADGVLASFVDAVERWDAEAADAAVSALLQSLPLAAVFEPLFRYAARDFRHLGHKAITAANCHRLLRVLGPGPAEPMLRSLVYALQNHGEGPNPARADLPPDRPWRRNLALSAGLPAGWLHQQGRLAPDTDLLPVLRSGSDAEAVATVIALLGRGVAPAQIWQALFLAAGELLLRQSGIIAVHANTTCNALHYGFRQARDDATRALLLLQGAAFLPLFRELMRADPQRDLTIDGLNPVEPTAAGQDRLAEIFADLGTDRLRAARKGLAYLSGGGAAAPFLALARHYTVTRNLGAHDYKFTEAAFENASQLSTPWRERYLAASVLYCNGPDDRHNPVVAEAQQLLAGA